MNKQGIGKIDWTDYTWNPVTGCLHGCEYCYMKRLETRFGMSMDPKFHEKRMNDIAKLKEPSKIFVCSTGDLWGKWVEIEWIAPILMVCKDHPQHTFQFLTKNPRGYMGYAIPKNCWVGLTIDGSERGIDILDKIQWLYRQKTEGNTTFISFEPLLDFVDADVLDGLNPDWFIIGANSNRGADKPEEFWATALIEYARKNNIAVWVKDNYQYHTKIKEFPQETNA